MSAIPRVYTDLSFFFGVLYVNSRLSFAIFSILNLVLQFNCIESRLLASANRLISYFSIFQFFYHDLM